MKQDTKSASVTKSTSLCALNHTGKERAFIARFHGTKEKNFVEKKRFVMGSDGGNRFVNTRHLLVFADKNFAAFKYDAFLLLKFFQQATDHFARGAEFL